MAVALTGQVLILWLPYIPSRLLVLVIAVGFFSPALADATFLRHAGWHWRSMRRLLPWIESLP